MTAYCASIPYDRDRVYCLLCPPGTPPMGKDLWAGGHFRRSHWQYYLSMMPKTTSDKLVDYKKTSLMAREKLARPGGDDFSAEEWISLRHVVEDVPTMADAAIVKDLDCASELKSCASGPVLIRRFVVVRQGGRDCLCLGIHT